MQEITTSPSITTSPAITTSPSITTSPAITTSPSITTSPTITTSPSITTSPAITTTPTKTPTATTTPTATPTKTPTATTTPTATPTKTPTATTTPTTTPPQIDLTTSLSLLISKYNLALIVWFAMLYLILYCIFGLFFTKKTDSSNPELKLSRMLDVIFLFFSLFIVISTYFSISTDNKVGLIQGFYDWIISFITSPSAIITIILVITIFYFAVYLFGIPMSQDAKPYFISFIEIHLWPAFLIIIIYDFFKYILNFNLDNIFKIDFTTNLYENTNMNPTTSTVSSTPSPTIPEQKEEVFNISNNLYTYDDAQSICSVYGAKLATYDQIEKTYNDGGEWCNYGWSDGQMIFFPTQKSTWQKLQENPKHKNDCGRPGVNGGYIANPYVKFGVNCFGKKPKPKDSDLMELNQRQNMVLPKTEDELVLDNKIDYWKQNADKLLKINSFNNNKWSGY